MTTKKLALGLLVGSICMLTSHVVWADFIEQEIKNQTISITANDLTLVFSQNVTEVDVIDKTGAGQLSLSTGDTHYTFKNFPNNFGPGDPAKIRFDGPKGTTIDLSQSFWTEDGIKINNALASLGAAPNLIFSGGAAFAQFTNPDPIALIYTGLQLYENNDLTNFDIANFLTPTGQLVTGIPSSIVLNPGESELLSFGPVLLNTYDLALANVAAVSNPGNTFSVGAAAAIPEPSTFTLLSVGFLVPIAWRIAGQTAKWS